MKKLISFILVLCMLLPTFSVFAIDNIPTDQIIDDVFKFDVGDFAAGNGDNNENTEDVTRFNRLVTIGVWDDATKSPNAFLTKTEFYVILSKLKFSTSNAFEGVYKYEANENKEYVTYLDAYTYLIDMLGYQHEYKVLGEGASATLIVADRIGLISGSPENVQAFITRSEFAKLIEKAISIDLCEVNYAGDGYSYEVKEGKTLLNTYHNTYDVSGFVNAIRGLAVFGSSDLREDYISIDRMIVKGEGIDYSAYYGKLVKAYAVYDENKNEYRLVYIEEETDTKTVEIDFKDIVSVNSYEVTYIKEDGNEYKLSVSGLKNISENGRILSALSEMSNYAVNEGKIVFCESKKYSGIDTAIIYKYNYFVVDYNDTLENKIGLKFGMKYNGETFVSIDTMTNNVVNIPGKEGVTVKDIPVGSSVRMFSCDETGYKEFLVSSEKPSGQVTSLYDDVIEVAGKSYRMSKYLLDRIKECEEDNTLSYYDKLIMPKLNDTVTLYPIDGIVVGFSYGYSYTYGYLKVFGEERTSIDPEMTLRIFTQNNEWVNLNFANKVELDGVNMSKLDAQSALKKRIGTDADAMGEIVRYKLNNDEKIVALDTIWEDPKEYDTEDDIKKAPDIQNGQWTGYMSWTGWYMEKDEITGLPCKYFIAPDAVIFVIPEDEKEEDEFTIVPATSLPRDASQPVQITLTLYNPDDFLQCKSVLYRGSLQATSADKTITYLHIESISQVLIDKEEQLYGYRVGGMQYINQRLKGKGICQKASFYLTEDVYNEIIEKGDKAGKNHRFKVGDIITFEFDGDNIIDFEMLIEGADIRNLEKGMSATKLLGVKKTVVVGEVEKVDVANMHLFVRYGEGDNDVIITSPRAKGMVDLSAGKTINGTMSDIHIGDKLFIITNTGHADMIVKNVQ